MYKIIGADGREYGPITADQLRQWIREGAPTRRPTSSPRGHGLENSQRPTGIADLLGSAGAGVPPVVGAVDPEALAAEILVRDYTIDIGRCIGRGWELVKKNFWLLIGVSFVGGLVAAGGGIPYLGPIIGLVVAGR